MVDGWQLLGDSAGLVALVLFPPVALGALFLLAWDRDLGGEGMGFGKRTFLLLVLGGALGWVANIPILLYHGSIMAINVGGALLPVAVSLLLLQGRLLAGRTRELALFLGGLAVAVAGLMAVLQVVPPETGPLVFVGAFIATGGAVLVVRGRLLPGGPGHATDLGAALGLVALATWGTFVSTQVVQNVGIVSSFPDYLVVPLIVGIVAVPLRWPRRDAPALAYATSTLGVLIGADVLHQPTLFAAPPFLGAIGGAGLLDLVFLSGPFALAVALGADRLGRHLRRGVPDGTPAAPGGPSAGLPPLASRLEPALRDLVAGRHDEVPRSALRALEPELETTRAVLGLPPVTPGDPLAGLPVHPLLHTDLANLRALASAGPVSPENARRAMTAAFLLQRGILEVLSTRLGRLGTRIEAFVLDLVLTMVPSVVVLVAVLELSSYASLDLAATSVLYNGTISAVGAWPFVLFVLMEKRWGATPGKWLLRLHAAGVDGGRLSWVAAVARNVPKLVPLAILSIALGLGVGYALLLPALLGGPVAVVLVLGATFLVGVVGFLSIWWIRATPRRQRFGDLLAATVVLQRPAPPPAFPGLTPWATSPMAPGPLP